MNAMESTGITPPAVVPPGSEPVANPKHEAYARHRAAGLPASEAARYAGLEPRNGAVTKLERNRKVGARLAWLTRHETEVAHERRAHQRQRLQRIAMLDRTLIFDDHGNLKPISEWPEDHRALIETIEPTKNGPKAVMSSKLVAEARLAELDGLSAPTKLAPTDPTGQHPASLTVQIVEFGE